MKRHRGHGEGTIRFREEKNLWVAEFTYTPGKRRTKYGKTQKIVRDWLDEQKRLVHDGLMVSDDQVTFGAYLKKWFDDVARHSLRDSTLIAHESVMRKHIFPELGDVLLGKLTAPVYKLFILRS